MRVWNWIINALTYWVITGRIRKARLKKMAIYHVKFTGCEFVTALVEVEAGSQKEAEKKAWEQLDADVAVWEYGGAGVQDVEITDIVELGNA